ncbi:hypothetical protein [Chryseobacterium sp.]|uniref:hypothetical protein n=1 Tax=Chryseobacterium sp. TaxID=1871047 RepID=UPI0028A2C1C9|nr:hypothetical protein [Chryseobacterium sp.]
MKACFIVALLFLSTLFSAQTLEKSVLPASLQEKNKVEIFSKTIHIRAHIQNSKQENIEKSKLQQDKNTLANHDFDKEIRAILDYRLSRVLREDLFCLICEVGFDERKLA